MVHYTRTTLPISEGQALVDEIIRPLVLHLVTMEFDTGEEARGFRLLERFGPERTADPRYTNQSIALRGLDEIPEIPCWMRGSTACSILWKAAFRPRRRWPSAGKAGAGDLG